jgi:sulfate transport system permease protein
MAGVPQTTRRPADRARRRGTEDPAWIRWPLIAIGMGFAVVFLLLPLLNLFVQAFSGGWKAYTESLTDPDAWSAIKLTLTVAAISVPMNVVFGVIAAWLIAKFDFRGKAFLLTLIDLPFAISPVVAGLVFVLLFGAQGYFGAYLQEHDIEVIYAVPGIALATIFVTLPFVAREVIPVLQATGREQEEAALTLGANGWQTFWRVTLPSMKWGLIYGIILCNARAMGEFGAVSVVSGGIVGQTNTLPLHIEKLHQEYHTAAAFAVASLLAMLAVVTLVLKTAFEMKIQREEELAQQAAPNPHASP